MATKILTCSCKSSYQDEVYGGGKRVHNTKKSADKTPTEARCTVCGTVRSIGDTGKKK